jgi:hypothetical protein
LGTNLRNIVRDTQPGGPQRLTSGGALRTGRTKQEQNRQNILARRLDGVAN